MFSVVIPLYNKENYIESTIKAVLLQNYKDFEVIVVDDSSTDNSLSIVQSIDDNRIRIFRKVNEGVSAARNYGVLKAKGDFIAFLDADDIWEPDYLGMLFQMTKEFPQAGLYCTAYKSFDSGCILNPVLGKNNYFILDDYFKMSVLNGLSVNITSATCVPKRVIKEMPMFRLGKCRGEDIDVWLRIALRFPVAYCKVPLMRYRTNTNNSLSINYTNASDEFPYEEWLYNSCPSKFYIRYVVLVIYIFAKRAYNARDFETCYHYLCMIKCKDIMYKGLKRLFYLIISFLKK